MPPTKDQQHRRNKDRRVDQEPGDRTELDVLDREEDEPGIVEPTAPKLRP
jgi:hypothetical protein